MRPEVNNDEILGYLESKLIKKDSPVKEYVVDAIKDSYKRLINPSIEREIRSDLTGVSEGEVTIRATSTKDTTKYCDYIVTVTLPKATDISIFIEENANLVKDLDI